MPEISGFEVAEKLRSNQKTQNIPIVIHTGVLLNEEEKSRLAHQMLTVTSKVNRESLYAHLKQVAIQN